MNIKSGKISRRLSKSACCQLGLLLVLAFAFPHQMFGQCSKNNAFNCAYVTDGAGGDIYAVDRGSGAVTKITSIKGTLNDIRVGADNFLYVTSNTAVSRLNESGSGKVTTIFAATKAIPGPFTGIRFTPLGDAYVNTPAGVYQIGPDLASGKHLIQISGPNFPAPVPLTDTTCSTSGGLAVWPTGDLLIGCNTTVNKSPVYEVLRCPATNGVASGCTGNGSQIQQLFTTSSAIAGLAVDAYANILVASSNAVMQFNCTSVPCTLTSTLATFTSDFPAYIDTAPFPAGFPPSQAGPLPGSPAPCNSPAVTTFVSTGDGSGKNGKVWTINTVDSNCAPNPSVNTLALVNSTRPAVGMGVASASRTLTKQFPSSNTPESFNSGPFSIQITPESLSNPPCNLSLTAQREAQAPLDAILAKTIDSNGNLVPSTAIPFDGEQGWRTSFHGGFPASGCTSNSDSHIGITAAINYVNPWIVLIDDSSGQAILDPIPSVFPGFSLDGVIGDPIKITNAGLFTSNARIVLVDRGFTVNNTKGYDFQGFLPPLVDPVKDPTNPIENTENAGKSFVVKFNLLVNGAPISDSQGVLVTAGVSIARLQCTAGTDCPDEQEMSINPEGNSASPPLFNYTGSGQFHFNVDTTNQLNGEDWCNGVYEVTANSDSFGPPHTLQFEIVGSPAYPSCF